MEQDITEIYSLSKKTSRLFTEESSRHTYIKFKMRFIKNYCEGGKSVGRVEIGYFHETDVYYVC